MTEQLACEGFHLEVRRSARRRTVGLTVDRGGELLLHAPSGESPDSLSRFVHAKRLWIHRKLALKKSMEAAVRSPEYVGGESFVYLGRRYRLTTVIDQEKSLQFDGHRFTLRRDQVECAEKHFRNWYMQTGSEWVRGRVMILARKIGASPPRVAVRDLGFRWGSCGKTGTIHLNWKLFQMPVRLVDYVIGHELAHLVERHHGASFQEMMGRFMPDWEARREEMKFKASEVYWCNAEMGS